MTERDISEQFYAALRPAFLTLLRAADYAIDTDSGRWDFAVPMKQLTALGFTATDLRWLVRKRYVEHADEVTSHGDSGRDFQRSGELTFNDVTCFILTEAGLLKARSLSGHSPAANHSVKPTGNSFLQETVKFRGRLEHHQPVPHWDGPRRELSFRGTIVKRFKWQGVNQEMILSTFEEDGWPAVIDDPLPPAPGQDPKRRLQNTIKALNRNQRRELIRFCGDGTGAGVRWMLVAAHQGNGSARTGK